MPEPAPTKLRLAITIATHNRLAELRRTCGQIGRLAPPPDELLIGADGCTDGSADWVRDHLPSAQLIESPQAGHSIRMRTRLMQAATADVVVGLDDDSYPLQEDFVPRVLRLFAANPSLGVASFAQRTDEFPETLTQEDFGRPAAVATYVNAASAIRRATWNELGGWPFFFEHMGDEPDFALRCLASGWDVVYEPSVIIRHHWSASGRSEIRNHHRHARNEQWSVWMRCPSPWWPVVSVYRAVRQFQYAWSRGRPWVRREPEWWAEALRGAGRACLHRRPVSWTVYRRWIELLGKPLTLPVPGPSSRPT